MQVESNPAMPSQSLSNAQARLAGLLYLGTILCGLFAELAVRSRVRAADAATAADNIERLQGLYRMGEAADLVMLCCYVAVTALLYRLFAPAARSIALIAAFYSLIGIAVLGVAGLLHLVPVVVADDGTFSAAGGVAKLALKLHGVLYAISLVFFGVYCTLIGWLCLTTRLLPRAVGLLMMAGGITHITTKFLWVLAPEASRLVPGPLNMLPLLGEAALALWLLAFGLGRAGN